jgi:Protein of unknown function (DUF4231)
MGRKSRLRSSSRIASKTRSLVSLKISGEFTSVVNWIVFSLGLLVSLSIAVEEFFHFGERWRHYRSTVELLKSEGWDYFQATGDRYEGKDYNQTYPVFAAQVEHISRQEVDTYIAEVAPVKEKGKGKPGAP